MIGQWPFFPTSSVTIWVSNNRIILYCNVFKKENEKQKTPKTKTNAWPFFPASSVTIWVSLYPPTTASQHHSLSRCIRKKKQNTRDKIKLLGQWTFSTNVIRYIWALLVTTFFANVQQAKNKNTGHTNAQKTQKQHKKNTFQTKINKNHLMPYEPCWPPLCSPTTALLPMMVQ